MWLEQQHQDGSAEATVLELATFYAADGELDWLSWSEMIGDLMCLREGMLEMDYEYAREVAKAIASACLSLEVRKVSTEVLVRVAQEWTKILDGLSIWLPQLIDPSLPDRLRDLRRLRRAEEGKWTFATGESKDMIVEEFIVRGENGWRFVDHGDGEGIVYWWPPADRRAEDAELIAVPVRLRQLDKIEQRLKERGQIAVDCGGDGDCFFKVLAYLLGHSSHEWCREETVAYMRRHASRFQATAVGLAPTFEAYCDAMAKDGTYVEGDAEILAAAARFCCDIHILGADPEHDALFKAQSLEDEKHDRGDDDDDLSLVQIHMVHYAHRQHYCAVVRKNHLDKSNGPSFSSPSFSMQPPPQDTALPRASSSPPSSTRRGAFGGSGRDDNDDDDAQVAKRRRTTSSSSARLSPPPLPPPPNRYVEEDETSRQRRFETPTSPPTTPPQSEHRRRASEAPLLSSSSGSGSKPGLSLPQYAS